MAYTTIVPQAINNSGTGLVPVYSAAPGAGAGNGVAIPGTGNVFLHVKNGGASPITVTVVTGGTAEGEPIADKAFTVNNASEKMIGPFRPTAYNQPSGAAQNAGQVVVDFSAITSVTVAAFQVG